MRNLSTLRELLRDDGKDAVKREVVVVEFIIWTVQVGFFGLGLTGTV